jgi:hypothetical protein
VLKNIENDKKLSKSIEILNALRIAGVLLAIDLIDTSKKKR